MRNNMQGIIRQAYFVRVEYADYAPLFLVKHSGWTIGRLSRAMSNRFRLAHSITVTVLSDRILGGLRRGEQINMDAICWRPCRGIA